MTVPALIQPALHGSPKFRPDANSIANLLNEGLYVEAIGPTPITGPVYFEMLIVSSNDGNAKVGMGALDYTGGVVYNQPGWLWVQSNNGAFFINGGYTGISLPSWGNGSLICFAYDPLRQLIWARVGAAGNWNGSPSANPATGSGGFSVAGMAGPLLPIAATEAGFVLSVTLNAAAASFSATPPTGFEDIAGTVWDPNPYCLPGDQFYAGGTSTFDFTTATGPVIECMALLDTGVSAGQYYCEYRVQCSSDSGTPPYAYFGLVQDTYSGPVLVDRSPPAAGLAAGAGTACFTRVADGAAIVDGAVSGSYALGSTTDTTQVFCEAFDASARLVWRRKAGGLWNGSSAANPATGVGGISLSDVHGALCPFVSYTSENTFTQLIVMTINAGQSAYVDTPPAGFGNYPSGVPLAMPARAGLQLMCIT